MSPRSGRPRKSLLAALNHLRLGYAAFMATPLVFWGAYFLFGEQGLVASAGAVSVILFVFGLLGRRSSRSERRDDVSHLEHRDTLEERTSELLSLCEQMGRSTAAFMIEVDAKGELLERLGQSGLAIVSETIVGRCQDAVRTDDIVAPMDEGCVGIVLRPVRRMDLEYALQLATRLQTGLEEPIVINGAPVYVSVSIGLCTKAGAPAAEARALLGATQTALTTARRAGPSAIRAYSIDMKRTETKLDALVEDTFAAFEKSEIVAWFQPQISTDTGQVTGLEALARWVHPKRGLIAPAEFLPALEHAALLERLSETMLTQACETLKQLDTKGVFVPSVGVNFSGTELRDPKLLDRVQWQLDQYDLSANRLTIEVVESVIAGSPDDVLVKNLCALHELGCGVDLDDFGTGHASITSLKRLPITRLKIDRSFVTKCDTDPDQQRMLTAILTMADRLNLDTIAEGLETVAEHALVSQLGVGHVQGFGIARPMPSENLWDWVTAHQSRLAPPPAIGRQ